jgi:hypothetical protein
MSEKVKGKGLKFLRSKACGAITGSPVRFTRALSLRDWHFARC